MQIQERFFACLKAELHNLYGPTEASIDSTFWSCNRDSHGQTVPVGRPIANMQTYLLDSFLQPVPVGIPGELHLGGVGLARGIGALDLRVVAHIMISWVSTLPIAAGLSIFFFFFFKGLLG